MQHSHNTKPDRSSSQLLTAFVLNFFFALIEIVGGFFTNSVAILSDALHDLGDSLALGTAWYFERISRRGRDGSHTYGYRRYSVLGAIINAAVLISGSVFVIIEAASRIQHPEEVHATGMILIAILGILSSMALLSHAFMRDILITSMLSNGIWLRTCSAGLRY